MRCERDEFLIRRLVVGPSDVARAPVIIDQSKDVSHCVIEWKAPELGPGTKNPIETLV
jgi:hypothetical protein